MLSGNRRNNKYTAVANAKPISAIRIMRRFFIRTSSAAPEANSDSSRKMSEVEYRKMMPHRYEEGNG
jgi:hypothetical protein